MSTGLIGTAVLLSRALEANQIFNWKGIGNCIGSEGWQLAPPCSVTPCQSEYEPPAVSVDSTTGVNYCAFNGKNDYIAIKNTGDTSTAEYAPERTSTSQRQELTI
jgi:hypothetical protein